MTTGRALQCRELQQKQTRFDSFAKAEAHVKVSGLVRNLVPDTRTLLVLLRCNTDVSFPILGYLNRAEIHYAIGGPAAPCPCRTADE